jgi:type II secretory pathway component GspD/PulD (secretin)
MNLKCAVTQLRNPRSIYIAIALLSALSPLSTAAQAPASDPKPADAKPDEQVYQTFYLTNATDQQSLNDIVTDLRNVLPRAKTYAVQSQNAISMRATSDDLGIAQKVLADLDRPRKIYRLTYTVTDTGNGQSNGAQHYTLVAAAGDRTIFKQGDRIPIITGRTGEGTASPGTQVQYADIGLNIDATLATSSDALMLHSRVELSKLAEPLSGSVARDPDIRQTVLQGTSALVPGKPLVLGSLDIPGTTRHQEVEVVAELVR